MSSLAQFISKEFVVLPMLATDMGTAIEELLEPLRQHKILALDEHCAEGRFGKLASATRHQEQPSADDPGRCQKDDECDPCDCLH